MNAHDSLIQVGLQDFETLRLWALEHIDGLPDLDELDDDATSIIVSLRAVLTGHAGCTEASDYTPEQWRVLQLCVPKHATYLACNHRTTV